MRLEATNKNVRRGAKLAPPLPGRVNGYLATHWHNTKLNTSILIWKKIIVEL